MLILSIIIGPLLQSFFTAAQTAQKSRRMGDATLVAQNLIETVQATGLDDLVADVKSGSDALFGAGTDAAFYTYDDDSHTYAQVPAADLDSVTAADETLYVGVTGLNASAYDFDAMVRIDADAFGINDTDVASFTPMDVVFSQPTGSIRNPDILAAGDFANQAALLTGVDYAASDFYNGMKRVITIRVQEDGGVVTASALYEYSAKVQYTRTVAGVPQTFVEPLSASFTYDFYRGNLTDNFEGLYFFYYPNYLDLSYAGSGIVTTASYDDVINLYNWDDQHFSCFLIKQENTDQGWSDARLATLDAAYRAQVNQYESVIVKAEAARVLSNIQTDIFSGEKSSSIYVFYRIFLASSSIWYQAFDFGDGNLIVTEPGQRLYDVAVELYAPGGSFGVDAPVLSMDGSSLK